MNTLRVLGTAVVLAASTAGAARAHEAYFMAVFGSQRPNVNRPRHTHCFAVFVKVTGEACPDGPHATESFAISWLAADGVVKMRRLTPESGRNFDLDETMQVMLAQGAGVSMWGPYCIQKELYDRAAAQRAHLESGAVRYKAVDTGRRSARVSNCMHAVSDLAEGAPRMRIASPGWGAPAGYFITLRLCPWIIDPGQTYPWLAEELGLEAYPITRRDLESNPGAGPLWWMVECLRHRGLIRSAQGR
jgi:hypothetical protein